MFDANPVGMQTHPHNSAIPEGAVKDPPALPPQPSAEEVVDVAVEHTMPASDPTAIGAAVKAAKEEAPAAAPEPERAPTTDPWPWPHS